ncbi:MAG: hypothetical protein JXK93_01385 [Sphaerochaetaceae bacterium]|nr:hypothetical protein [Sphaerochaetaceae bacterium]
MELLMTSFNYHQIATIIVLYQEISSKAVLTYHVSAFLLACGLIKTIITMMAVHKLILYSFYVLKELAIAPPLCVARYILPAEISKRFRLELVKSSVSVGKSAECSSDLARRADQHIITRKNVQWLIEEGALP